MNETIVLFGAGKRAEYLLNLLDKNEFLNIIVLDNNEKKWGKKIGNCFIEKPHPMEEKARWCITIADESVKKRLRRQCLTECALQEENEIGFYQVVFECFRNCELLVSDKYDNTVSKTILLDCTTGFIMGGVETWTLNLYDHLKSNGIDSAFLVVPQKSGTIPEQLNNSLLFFQNGEYRYEKETVFSYLQILEDHKPCDVILSNANEMLLASCMKKKICPAEIHIYAVVHNEHESIINPFLEYWKEFTNIDFFLGVSNLICEKLKEAGIPEDQIRCITMPVACPKRLDREYCVGAEREIRIGYAGRIDGFEGSQKRMDLILRYIEELEKTGIRYRFELAGDGEATEEMRNQLDRMIINNRIIFLGRLPHEEMDHFWRSQDICINLSDYEGHSITQMEAMANGAVPILTDVSGVRDDVLDGVNGFIIPLEHYKLAVEKTCFLYSHPDELVKMGKKAHQEILEKNNAEKYMSLWGELLHF